MAKKPKAQSTENADSEGPVIEEVSGLQEMEDTVEINADAFVEIDPPLEDFQFTEVSVEPSELEKKLATKTVKTDPELFVGAYRSDGDLLVRVDSLNLRKLFSAESDRAAYDHRLTLGLANYAIEKIDPPRPIMPGEKPGSLVTTGKGKVYRCVYRLTPPI